MAIRYSAVPWLADSDLLPAGGPDATVEGDREIAHGLRIRAPFGEGSDTTITIHAYRSGHIYIAEAQVTDVMKVDGESIEPAQSNPRRDEGED